ncbi:MAG: sodium:solute symporter, partial [Sediminibacterium sp.]|nr:sodium:solute symporter [Sediminibacterium sp.]
FTYGPLLGLFSFAIFTNRKLNNKWVYFICLLAPSLCFVIDYYQYKFTYQFGLEILILNGIFTFVGLLIISKKNKI